jgi:hypothetical protein
MFSKKCLVETGLIDCSIISIDIQCITSEQKGNKGKKMGRRGG